MSSAGRICIVVHEEVHDLIADTLGQYEADLAAMGHAVVTLVYSSGSPEALRAYLAQLYREPESLVGAVFVGDIPYVLFEMYESFGGGTRTYTDFPMDLFFMDLDGIWSDRLDDDEIKPQNGKYDTWTGHRELEIWVCRLKPSAVAGLNTGNLSSAELQSLLLNTFFEKNHRYRVGTLAPSHEGLVYNDDLWESFGPDDARALAAVFGESHVVSECRPEVTTKEDYLTNRLPLAPQLVLLRAHGFVAGHIFDPDVDYVLTGDYRDLDPRTPFFSLYVCSGSDFTVNDSLSGTLVFNPEGLGLLTWGTTKTGGMWNDSPFYQRLGEDRVFGEAFRLWFNDMLSIYGALDGFVLKWWGGMVLTGDAALKPLTEGSPKGSLTVTLSPPEAVAAGARWKVDGGDWQQSGTTVEGLCVLGEHTVQFESIPGWVAPPKRGIGFAGGLTQNVSSLYATEGGSVQVTLDPHAAVGAGARWRLDGGLWLRSGASLAGVSGGSQALEVKDLLGWTKPSDQVLTVENGSITLASGTYLQQSGSLAVSFQPDTLTNARWRLDGGNWQTGGTTIAGLPVGPHWIEFSDVSGWTKPPAQFVSIIHEQTAVLVGTYTPLLLADFTAAPTMGTAPLQVTFTDKSTATSPSGPPRAWLWDFGDGSRSTRQNPVYTYRKPGLYTVTLKVTSTDGYTSTRTYPDYISVHTRPRAVFTARPLRGRTPLTVSFKDQSTGAINSWDWDFGDGSRSNERSPRHTYSTPGRYTARLKVSGPMGTSTTTRAITALR